MREEKGGAVRRERFSLAARCLPLQVPEPGEVPLGEARVCERFVELPGGPALSERRACLVRHLKAERGTVTEVGDRDEEACREPQRGARLPVARDAYRDCGADVVEPDLGL